MKFLISHRPGQGHFKDSSLVFSNKYLFDFPLFFSFFLWFSSSSVKQEEDEVEGEGEEEEEEDDDETGILQFTRKSWKLQTLLWQCLGDLNNIKGFPGWFFNITQSH